MATRPASANGLGLTSEQVHAETDLIEQAFGLLPDQPAIHAMWRDLVDRYAVMGRQVFDARLVAVMLVHGVNYLLTFNGSHFARYREIMIHTPETVGMAQARARHGRG